MPHLSWFLPPHSHLCAHFHLALGHPVLPLAFGRPFLSLTFVSRTLALTDDHLAVSIIPPSFSATNPDLVLSATPVPVTCQPPRLSVLHAPRPCQVCDDDPPTPPSLPTPSSIETHPPSPRLALPIFSSRRRPPLRLLLYQSIGIDGHQLQQVGSRL
ncbi:hypothetical protein C8R44DRAFT_880429 [Mycena epipterygia]|nr:hypothetical protein C8R44DRAFT_880429 [Mycena epipterygia]